MGRGLEACSTFVGQASCISRALMPAAVPLHLHSNPCHKLATRSLDIQCYFQHENKLFMQLSPLWLILAV